MSNNYKICLDEIKDIINKISEGKLSVEKAKNKFYESCKLVREQEKLIFKGFSYKIITSDEEIYKVQEDLLGLKSLSDNHSQAYKYEITKYNKMLDDLQKKYYRVMERLKIHEEERILLLRANMEKFANLWEEYSIATTQLHNV